MIRLLTLLAFFIELPVDRYLIDEGKEDIHWETRWAIMMFSIAVIAFFTDHTSIYNLFVCSSKDFALALAPYCWFDILLNWSRGKKWYYQGENGKWWDNAIKKLYANHPGFNRYFILVARAVAFVLLLIYGR